MPIHLPSWQTVRSTIDNDFHVAEDAVRTELHKFVDFLAAKHPDLDALATILREAGYTVTPPGAAPAPASP